MHLALPKKHTKPEKSALVARCEFDNRFRKIDEFVSVSDYVATLKHLASECKFSDATRAERLRDRLLSGIKDDKMLRDLKEKLEDLTFENANLCDENREMVMELDTGLAVSVIGKAKYQEHLSKVPLASTTIQLLTYTGEIVKLTGCMEKSHRSSHAKHP